MCLVIGVLLFGLGINFYIDGFLLQAAISATAGIYIIAGKGKNHGCTTGSCNPKTKEDNTDDN